MMANIDGVWDCIAKSPMGEQKSVLTIESVGDSFTGTNAGPMGVLEIRDGKVNGVNLTWTMDMTSPFAMKLEAAVSVEGDKMIGTVKAGAFGSSPLQGTRRS
jgi:hypothetical protein